MRYLILLSLLFSASLSAGSIQKWVDEEGNVHYGDSPPISAKTKEVRVLSAPSDPGKALPRLSTSSSNTDETAKKDDTTLPEDQAKAACAAAQEDLKVINSSNRIKLKSADGSTRYMTTEEIEARRKSSEEDIKNFCQ